MRVSVASSVTRPSPCFIRKSEIITAGLLGEGWPKAAAQDIKTTIAPNKNCFIANPPTNNFTETKTTLRENVQHTITPPPARCPRIKPWLLRLPSSKMQENSMELTGNPFRFRSTEHLICRDLIHKMSTK
jgi:hypothetical protein